MHTIFWFDIVNAKDHPEDLAVDVRILLKWIVRKYDLGDVD
jgi:hypothetical protein